jgi:hypothetical protein
VELARRLEPAVRRRGDDAELPEAAARGGYSPLQIGGPRTIRPSAALLFVIAPFAIVALTVVATAAPPIDPKPIAGDFGQRPPTSPTSGRLANGTIGRSGRMSLRRCGRSRLRPDAHPTGLKKCRARARMRSPIRSSCSTANGAFSRFHNVPVDRRPNSLSRRRRHLQAPREDAPPVN